MCPAVEKHGHPWDHHREGAGGINTLTSFSKSEGKIRVGGYGPCRTTYEGREQGADRFFLLEVISGGKPKDI